MSFSSSTRSGDWTVLAESNACFLTNACDVTAFAQCYSRRVLEKMKFNKVKFVGYAFQIEMKYTATRLGFKIYEVPIVFTDRVLGTSKMSMKIFKEAFFGVFNLRFRNWKNY